MIAILARSRLARSRGKPVSILECATMCDPKSPATLRLLRSLQTFSDLAPVETAAVQSSPSPISRMSWAARELTSIMAGGARDWDLFVLDEGRAGARAATSWLCREFWFVEEFEDKDLGGETWGDSFAVTTVGFLSCSWDNKTRALSVGEVATVCASGRAPPNLKPNLGIGAVETETEDCKEDDEFVCSTCSVCCDNCFWLWFCCWYCCCSCTCCGRCCRISCCCGATELKDAKVNPRSVSPLRPNTGGRREALTEEIVESLKLRCKVIFATHFR